MTRYVVNTPIKGPEGTIRPGKVIAADPEDEDTVALVACGALSPVPETLDADEEGGEAPPPPASKPARTKAKG